MSIAATGTHAERRRRRQHQTLVFNHHTYTDNGVGGQKVMAMGTSKLMQ